MKFVPQFSDEETVAFVMGGYGPVELYTPDGSCVASLAPQPFPMFKISLSYVNKSIVACGASGWWNYNIAENSWAQFTSPSSYYRCQVSGVYNDKLYIVEDHNSEVFDSATNTWSPWPAPPAPSGDGPCLVTYQDSFLMFGGSENSRGAQQFNHTSNEWINLNPASVPKDMVNSGCILLPNGQDVLIVGSSFEPFQSAASIYNVQSNTFMELPDTEINRDGTSLVQFGSRIFAIGGRGQDEKKVEEFNYGSNTWTSGFADLRELNYDGQAVVTLPKALFKKYVSGCTSVVN